MVEEVQQLFGSFPLRYRLGLRDSHKWMYHVFSKITMTISQWNRARYKLPSANWRTLINQAYFILYSEFLLVARGYNTWLLALLIEWSHIFIGCYVMVMCTSYLPTIPGWVIRRFKLQDESMCFFWTWACGCWQVFWWQKTTLFVNAWISSDLKISHVHEHHSSEWSSVSLCNCFMSILNFHKLVMYINMN